LFDASFGAVAAGSMKYTDILAVYRQAIYFGTLGH
jgi:hypothetical protein